MSQSESIAIYNNGVIHIIHREPYETNMDVYKRGWFIIKNKDKYNSQMLHSHHSLLSISLIDNYKNKGMVYEYDSLDSIGTRH
jgi:hypothetical protein